MVDNSNPFYVRTASPFDALLAGVEGYDRGRKTVKENELKAGRANAMQRLMAGDLQGALGETLSVNDPEGAKVIAQLAKNQTDERYGIRSLDIQERSTDATIENQRETRAQEAARLAENRRQYDNPQGWDRVPLPGGGLGMSPTRGGPNDLGYIRDSTAAKKEPENPFKNEDTLRKEFEGQIKPYLESRRGYERLLASKDTAAGDISLIFGFMKMLDPGSVVREGEFATAQNSASVPDQIKNAYNRALTGQRLNPEQRQQFKSQADEIYGKSRAEYETREAQTRASAKAYSLNPDRIIVPLPRLQTGPRGPDLPPPPGGFTMVQ